MKGCEVGADRHDPLSRDVFDHVAPMRADVAHRPERTCLFRLDAPVPVGVVKQPVLRIRALRDQDFPEVAALTHPAHLLHHGVVAQVVTGGVADRFGAGQPGQRRGFRTRHRQRLLAQNVLARFERGRRHREVPRVWRADVDRTYVRIGEKGAVIAFGPFNAERAGEAARLVNAAADDSADVDEAEPAHRLQVDTAHETGSNDRGAHAPGFHDELRGYQRRTSRREHTSERVLEADEGRHLVTDTVIVEREEQVGIEKQAIEKVDLDAQRAAQRVERFLREGDVAEHRLAVERVKILAAEPLGIDQISAKHVERQRQVTVGAHVRAGGVDRLIGEVRRLTRGRIAGDDARAVPLIACVEVRRHPLIR